MTALALIEAFIRCDESKPDWLQGFAKSLSEICTRDPDMLIGCDDGSYESSDDVPEPSHELDESDAKRHYLKLVFENEDAAYYQFWLYPPLSEPYISGAARKREGRFQHLMVELAGEDILLRFIKGLRTNPHLVAVEESSEEIFNAAPSNSI